ncbi:hypothetical protein LOK49_LG08G00712 [Camellia lanceoleosa]|uniref:Uncharacterized protein n=1 Tax=Camellia lanceoleosa TaxID=1840588 RepID=A0ACC0GPA8_9ERIC|nr:hypothetical protein LOK49_LG08G00712 [Camellia lanceoleosa]
MTQRAEEQWVKLGQVFDIADDGVLVGHQVGVSQVANVAPLLEPVLTPSVGQGFNEVSSLVSGWELAMVVVPNYWEDLADDGVDGSTNDGEGGPIFMAGEANGKKDVDSLLARPIAAIKGQDEMGVETVF